MFHFYSNGTFDLLNVPGKSKNSRTLNTYVLTVWVVFASQGNRDFNNSMAREFCEQIGCYDQDDHAADLKSRGNEFTGDRSRGYTITNPGMKKCVALTEERLARASEYVRCDESETPVHPDRYLNDGITVTVHETLTGNYGDSARNSHWS